jgi:hypothetical protein
MVSRHLHKAGELSVNGRGEFAADAVQVSERRDVKGPKKGGIGTIDPR